jgi:hypothetical protein
MGVVIGWLVDWLIGWLIDWLIDWLIGWLVDWLIGWLVDWLIGWLVRGDRWPLWLCSLSWYKEPKLSAATSWTSLKNKQQVNNSIQLRGFFAARAFALQNGQNLGCNLFTRLSPRAYPRFCKKLLCPATLLASIVLPIFGRSLSTDGKEKTALLCHGFDVGVPDFGRSLSTDG